jgi:hypothetical protein
MCEKSLRFDSTREKRVGRYRCFSVVATIGECVLDVDVSVYTVVSIAFQVTFFRPISRIELRARSSRFKCDSMDYLFFNLLTFPSAH